jgi:hypothetical protein
MTAFVKERPSSALVIAILKAIPQASLTPSTYQVVLDAANMVDNALQPYSPLVLDFPQTKTEKVSYLEEANTDCKRAIAIILSNTQKSKNELPFFKEMNWQQILDWVQANEPQLMEEIAPF